MLQRLFLHLSAAAAQAEAQGGASIFGAKFQFESRERDLLLGRNSEAEGLILEGHARRKRDSAGHHSSTYVKAGRLLPNVKTLNHINIDISKSEIRININIDQFLISNFKLK
jgi:hypothetical protein